MNIGGSLFLVMLLLFAAFMGLGVVLTQNKVLRGENLELIKEVKLLQQAKATESQAKEKAEGNLQICVNQNKYLSEVVETERREKNQCLAELGQFHARDDQPVGQGGALEVPAEVIPAVQSESWASLVVMFLAAMIGSVAFGVLSAMLIIDRKRIIRRLFGPSARVKP